MKRNAKVVIDQLFDVDESSTKKHNGKLKLFKSSSRDTLQSLGYVTAFLPSVGHATAFQAASISKPITGMAVMRLHQRGVLDLDADITEYLPNGWRIPVSLPDGVGVGIPCITLRLLFAHAAGINVWGFDGYSRVEKEEGGKHMPKSTLEILKGGGNSAPVVLNTVPAMIPQYSGGGMTVAQFVVETVTGKSIAQVIREEVIEPLGLENTCVYGVEELMTGVPNGGDFACGHVFEEGVPVAGGYRLYPETAAAGVWSTPMDILRIQDALVKSIAGKRIRMKDGKEDFFLEKDLASEMVTPRFPTTYGGGPGVGWFASSSEFSHSGMNEGYICHTMTMLKSGAGICWMASNDGSAFEMLSTASDEISKVYGFDEEEADEVDSGETRSSDQARGKEELTVASANNGEEIKQSIKKRVLESLQECVGTYEMIVSENGFSRDFPRPVIRVEASLSSPNDALVFYFDSLVGGVEVFKSGGFQFTLLERIKGEFSMTEGGATVFGFNGQRFIKRC
ncbi:UNVERIFIED_CONTAM: hypothetical protein HDU68_012134 [Siphonaria sp. JEL0065]|nr:hypothetical protein HDU68_012134 [Siphonaria sp. JEL0065]